MPAPTIPHLRVPLEVLGGGPERTNLCTNPSGGALATTGWSVQDTPTTFAATGALPTLVGLPAGITTGFHVVGDSAGDGASITFSQVLDAAYSVSIYAHIASSTASGLRLSRDGSSIERVDFAAVGGNFTRIDCSFSGTATGITSIRVRQLGAGAIDFYFTAVLLEQSGSLGPYFPNAAQLASGQATWNGEPNASTSTLASPLATLAAVEQDSAEEIEQCVEACLRTPAGSRIDAPEYGIPDETFTQLSPNPSAEAYLGAVEAAEPRAHLLGEAEIEDMTKRVTIKTGTA